MAYSTPIAGTSALNNSAANCDTSAIDTTGADLIIVAVASYSVVTAPTLTDNKGNTWTPLTAYASGESRIRLYYCQGGTVGTGHTWNAAAASSYPCIAVIAVSGSAASPFDTENGAASNSASSLATGGITPTENDCLVISAVCDRATSAASVDSGMTLEEQSVSTGLFGVSLAYKIQTTAAAIDPTWTLGGSTQVAVAIASFKAAGGGGYTLTADGGTFSLTGQAAGLRAARTMPAAQGSYSLAGQAAGLSRGYPLVAGSGSFALAGQSAGLVAARQLPAAVGAYTLTGQPAGLTAARLLAAATGTFTLAGQDVTLTYSPLGAYTLAAATGTFTLAGQAAGLTATRTLAAGVGSFALSGQAAGLYRGLTLVGGAGVFGLTGQAVAFVAARRLAAAQGSYTLTGQAVTLTYGAGGVVEMAARPGGVFRRADPGRLFRRADPGRVFRRSPAVAADLAYQTRTKRPTEVVAFVFDFSNFPEVVAGGTLGNPSVPAVSGLTIGTPEVTVEDITEGTLTIDAGEAVAVTVSGGTADTDYAVTCYADITRGGDTATRAVKGVVAVR